MTDTVLVISRLPKAQLERIGARFDLLDGRGQPPLDAFGADKLKPIRAVITAGSQPIPHELLDAMPELGAVVCYGTGYDGIDFAEMKKRNIVVGNSPAANAAAVADLAMTLMLAVTRRLLPADEYVRSGGWSGSQPSPLMKPQQGLPKRRVGIYGMGEIGRKIAARVAAFECDVTYHSRRRHDVPYRYEASLHALVDWCEVLMIAVRAGADTQHIIDADMLKRLGPDGYLVNISRGSVIDQAALTAALSDGAIAGAGLDVYEKEPHSPDALTKLPNVVLTPHVGGHTLDAHTGMQDCVIANLEAFFTGRELPYGVRG